MGVLVEGEGLRGEVGVTDEGPVLYTYLPAGLAVNE